MNKPKPARRSRSIAVAALLILVVIPVLYALGPGPAIVLKNNGYVSDDFLITAYYPLIHLAANFEPVDQFYDWYMAFLHE